MCTCVLLFDHGVDKGQFKEFQEQGFENFEQQQATEDDKYIS